MNRQLLLSNQCQTNSSSLSNHTEYSTVSLTLQQCCDKSWEAPLRFFLLVCCVWSYSGGSVSDESVSQCPPHGSEISSWSDLISNQSNQQQHQHMSPFDSCCRRSCSYVHSHTHSQTHSHTHTDTLSSS